MDNKLLTMKIWNDVYFLTRSPGPNYLLLTSNTPIYWSTLQKKNIFLSFFNVKRIQVLIVSFNQYSAWYSQKQLITSNFQSPFLHITRAQQIVYDNIWEKWGLGQHFVLNTQCYECILQWLCGKCHLNTCVIWVTQSPDH